MHRAGLFVDHRRKRRRWWQWFGPGIITGASDDDPSGIATYSQAGARFGFEMLWTMAFTYPLMSAIQEASARIGRVTGHGIAGNLRRFYPRWLLFTMVMLLVASNTITIAADIAAMGAAARLEIGHGHAAMYATVFAVVCVVLELYVSYRRYARYLLVLTSTLSAYLVSLAVIQIDWSEALGAALWPKLELDADYLVMVVAVFGTTISPYLFFWQAAQEVEEEHAGHHQPLRDKPDEARAEQARITVDTLVGMGVSNLIGFAIILVAGATLHHTGHADIKTAADAAAALAPLAGRFASTLFVIGIIGAGLLAVPVLAGSAAYAVGEAMEVTVGIARKPHEAKLFSGVIVAASFVGLAIVLTGIDPIRALILAAVISGVVAAPIMATMMVMGSSPRVMSTLVLPLRVRIVGWLATVVMFGVVIAMIATSVR